MKENNILKESLSSREKEIEKLEHNISTKQTTEESLSKEIQYLSEKVDAIEKQKQEALEVVRIEKSTGE